MAGNVTALMRFKEVADTLSIAKSTLYKWITQGRFPKPTPFGPRMVAWRREEVQAWIDANTKSAATVCKKIAAVSDDREKLLAIIASAYQIAGYHEAPAHILDVLAAPEEATDEQVEAMLPYQPAACPDPVSAIVDRHIPPVPRRVIDCDLNGKPIYADEVVSGGRTDAT